MPRVLRRWPFTRYLRNRSAARFVSQLISEAEVIRKQISTTRQPAEIQVNKNTSEHHVRQRAVKPSEIRQPPDLAAFIKPASSPRAVRAGRTSSATLSGFIGATPDEAESRVSKEYERRSAAEQSLMQSGDPQQVDAQMNSFYPLGRTRGGCSIL